MEHEHLRSHDLNLFVIFATLMAERNVTRTAARLHMSQAAVSAALQRLRRDYGDELFIRAPGGMAPTVAAQRMHEPVLRGLAALKIAVGGEANFDPFTDQFVMRIGMSDDLEVLLMPDLLTAVARMNPVSSVHSLQTTRARMTDLLGTGQVELGISATSAWSAEFRTKALFDADYACLFDPRMVGHSGPLSREDFLQLPHVMISADGTRGIVDDVLESEGLTRRRVASTSHFAMVPFLLTRAASVATMPRYAAQLFAAKFGLATADSPIPLPPFTVALVWHEARDQDRRIQWMVSLVAGIAERLTTNQDQEPTQ